MLAYIIHAHFYQPSREDPLTGVIPVEAGAKPYPNWNEKIYAECYQPNVEQGNFRKISFNIGPTLFNWFDHYHPETSRKIVEHDLENVRKHGVGNAIAQSYNHTILPLMSRKDKATQVTWGIADFYHRFKRLPQGMWLPETAVDDETLDIMSNAGIQFTILAPWQAEEANIDPTVPYRVKTSSGREIIIFFYQQSLSTRISFDPWSTINADVFTEFHLLPSFNPEKTSRNESQVILIATDGELYGHHQPMRNYFLERLMDGATTSHHLVSTFPGLWLHQHKVQGDTRIRENTSWSCHHGLGRWLGECDCTPGDKKWKIHFRRALVQLAGALDGLFLELTRPFIPDPWGLRDQYIHVILGEKTLEQLVFEVSGQVLKSETLRRLNQMMEAQRERQRMFTSCGWFFDDFDRIEPRNNIAYAAQAVVLAHQATGVDLTREVLEDLHLVTSHLSGINAADIFNNRLELTRQISKMTVGFAS